MSGFGYLLDAISKKSKSPTQEQFTIGQVVDTNDPQQMGRVRAFCPAFGDNQNLRIEQIPWAMYVAPFGGITNFGTRGVDESQINGPVAYGMWNIPKIGAYVLIGCIDGDKSMRFYAGCIQPQFMTHTMPHGRFTWNDTTEGTPDGPLDSYELPIDPLYSNYTDQFTKQGDKHASGTPSDPRANMEWRTRGVDNQVSAITSLHTNHPEDGPGSQIADHEWGEFITITEENGTERVIRGPGYGVDQQEPDDAYPNTGGINYDSLVYSWTTPGFHSISMNDRHENFRIRIRTTSGHQIIMDDTNERIYVNAAGGESWIEIDKVGNIDIHAGRNISMHAGGDINYTTDQSFRVHAKEGIHMYTDDEFRVHSQKDANIRTEQFLRTHSKQETRIEADQNIHIETAQDALIKTEGKFHAYAKGQLFIHTDADLHVDAGSNGFITTGAQMNINAGSDGLFTSGSQMHIKSSGNTNMTAAEIHFNGPEASTASTAESANQAEDALEKHAYWTSRVPQHEPWARVFMKKKGSEGADNDGVTVDIANTHVPEYPYNSDKVGKGSEERGETYNRNDKWHR